MGEVEWIKLSTGMFGDRKIKQIESMPDGDTIIVIWVKLLILAGEVNDGGAVYITPEMPYTPETMADEVKRPVKTVQLALSTFEKFRLIHYDEYGILYITNWEKHQNVEGMERIREQNRIRKRKQREREKLASGGSHVTVTGNHAIEEEREEDKNKNKISIYLSEPDEEENSEFSTGFSTDFSTREDAKRSYLQGELGRGVVMLSNEQMDILLDFLSIEEFDHYVSVVAHQIIEKGRKYGKTHYQAIMEMAAKDRQVKR